MSQRVSALRMLHPDPQLRLEALWLARVRSRRELLDNAPASHLSHGLRALERRWQTSAKNKATSDLKVEEKTTINKF
jgi:hypothetical protein